MARSSPCELHTQRRVNRATSNSRQVLVVLRHFLLSLTLFSPDAGPCRLFEQASDNTEAASWVNSISAQARSHHLCFGKPKDVALNVARSIELQDAACAQSPAFADVAVEQPSPCTKSESVTVELRKTVGRTEALAGRLLKVLK